MSIKTSIGAKQVTHGVISYLKKSKNLHLLPQVAREALKLSHHQLDPNTAVVESAVPLTEDQKKALQTNLNALFKRELNLVPVLSPQLLGGLKIKVGDQIIDQSLNARINQLTRNISL